MYYALSVKFPASETFLAEPILHTVSQLASYVNVEEGEFSTKTAGDIVPNGV